MTDQARTPPGGRVAHKKSVALLVDGYARDLFTTGLILQRMDYDVYITNTGEDALKIINAALPALVITELALPEMSGLELLVRIKHDAHTKSLPVVIHTSLDDDKKKELCRASGCSAYLKKPADPGRLFSAIQKATHSTPREFFRLRTLLPVRVGAATGNPGTEYATELSEAGIFVRTLNPRPINAVLPVTIIIRSVPIKLKAQVVYAKTLSPGLFREPGMGMKFVEISSTDQEVLRNIIKGQILKDIASQ